MATSTNIKELLPRLLGISPATLDRQIRALLLARMLPLGKRGGGKGAAHYGATELAVILLGQAGMLPSDAPDAVKALRSMPFRGQHPGAKARPPLPHLEDMLAYWIEKAGTARRAGGKWLAESEAVFRSWKMQLCVNPCHAIIWVTLPDGESTTIIYASAEQDEMPAESGTRRLTVIFGDVLLALGELLADTEKQIPPPPSSFLDQVSAKASPKNENTDVSCHGASVPSKSQSHHRTNTVCQDVLDVSGERSRSQANVPVLAAGCPPKNDRSSQCLTTNLFA